MIIVGRFFIRHKDKKYMNPGYGVEEIILCYGEDNAF